jgi:4-nitrophenyl phosphatase
MDRPLDTTLRLIIFDLDGVMYRGRQPVPGAAELVASLRAAGLLIRFATNNSMTARSGYVPRLVEMGVPTEVDEIVTSTSATVDHLRAHLPDVRRVMAVGAPGMLDELRAARFDAVAAADAVGPSYDGGPLDGQYDAVVAGLDPSFDFRRLAAATTAIRSGARFVATNADIRYPTPTGFLPGAGSIVAAVQAASGVEPLVIGKPEPGIFTAILERAGIRPEHAVAIGDNPDADMVAAHRAGMRSILVLTGVADGRLAATLDGERRPDHIAEDPDAVGSVLRRWLS